MTNDCAPEKKAPVSLERLKSDFEAIMQLKDQDERARRWAIFEQQLRDLQTSLSDQYNEGLELLKQRYATLQEQGSFAAGSEVAQDALSMGGNVLNVAGGLLASQGAEFQRSGELLVRDTQTVLDGSAKREDRIASGVRLGIVGAGVLLLSRWLLKNDPDAAKKNEKKGFMRKVAGGFWTALKVLGVFALASRAVNYFGPNEEGVPKISKAEVPPIPPKSTVPSNEPAQPKVPKQKPVAVAPANPPQAKVPGVHSKPKEPSSPVETEKDGWKFGEHRMSLVERGGGKFLSVDGRVFHTDVFVFFIKNDVSGSILGVERRSDGSMHVRYTIPLLGEGSADVSYVECVKAAETLAKAKGAVTLTIQTTEKGKKKERQFACAPQ